MSELDFPITSDKRMVQQTPSHIPTNRELLIRMFNRLRSYLRYNGQLSPTDQKFVREVMTRFMYLDLLFSRIEESVGPNLSVKYRIEDSMRDLYDVINPILDDPDNRSISIVDIGHMDWHLGDIIHQIYHPDPKHSLMERIAMKIVDLIKKMKGSNKSLPDYGIERSA